MNPTDPLALATAARVTIVTLENEIRRIAPESKKVWTLLADLWTRVGAMQTALEAQATPASTPDATVAPLIAAESSRPQPIAADPSIAWTEETPLWQRFQEAVDSGIMSPGMGYSAREVRDRLAFDRGMDEAIMAISINRGDYSLERIDGRYYVTPRGK